MYLHIVSAEVRYRRALSSLDYKGQGALGFAVISRLFLVPRAGLEPASHSAEDFKSSVFTNFTTEACVFYLAASFDTACTFWTPASAT